jgi:hypothetical protein
MRRTSEERDNAETQRSQSYAEYCFRWMITRRTDCFRAGL